MISEACVGIINFDNKILAVNSVKRGKLGLPGGKKNKNESDLECIIREIEEETSLHVINAIYLGNNPDTKWENKLVTLFYIDKWKGEISSSIEGETLWVDWENLLNPYTSYFPEWNKWAYEKFTQNIIKI